MLSFGLQLLPKPALKCLVQICGSSYILISYRNTFHAHSYSDKIEYKSRDSLVIIFCFDTK